MLMLDLQINSSFAHKISNLSLTSSQVVSRAVLFV